VQTIETNSFETTTFETCSFETTFTWDHIHLRPIHLRPIHLRLHSFETTFIWDLFVCDLFVWDYIHLRPQSFKTTFIWNTFIWDHIRFRSHSFYATLKLSCFDLLWITFLWSTFHFFAGDLKFCKMTLHLRFCKVTPFCIGQERKTYSLTWSKWFFRGATLHSNPEVCRVFWTQRYFKVGVHLQPCMSHPWTRKGVTLHNFKWRGTLQTFRYPTKRWMVDHKNLIHSTSKQLHFNVA